MLFNIQALRALAALLVVMVHLGALGEALGFEKAAFDVFAAGVDLFFVISGFIMVLTVSRKPVSPAGFMLNRFIRIAPLYWVLTLAVFALALAAPFLLGSTRADWESLTRSLAFIPYQRADGTLRPILFVGWSLNLEMAFYCVFALALAAKGLGRQVGLGIGLLSLAVAGGVIFRSRLGPEWRFLTQPLLLEFAAGMAIGWLFPKLPASRSAAAWAGATGVIALMVLVSMPRWPLPHDWPVSLIPACFVVLGALVAEKGGLVMTWPPLQALGSASYALYLTHPFVTQAWIVAASRGGFLTANTAPFLMGASMLSAMVVAMIVHAKLERPLGRAAQALLAKLGTVRGRRGAMAGPAR